MTDKTKDLIIFFLLGFLVGGGVAVWGGVKIYHYLKSPAAQPQNEVRPQTTVRPSSPPMKELVLSFEKDQDMSFFSGADGASVESSSSHAIDGKKSLMVKIPTGASFPGISWEAYGKDVMSWAGGGELVAHVYNNSESDVSLIVKIKSGRDYPKKSFETSFNLKPLADNEIRLSLINVSSQCDLQAISYLKMFVQNPSQEAVLYFDHIRIER